MSRSIPLWRATGRSGSRSAARATAGGVEVLAGGGLDGAGRDFAAEVVDGDDRVRALVRVDAEGDHGYGLS